MPTDAERLATFHDVGLAPIRGRFTVVQSPTMITVSVELPEDIAAAKREISGVNPRRLAYTPALWNDIFHMDGGQLVAQFQAKTPIRFRRAQTDSRVTQAGPQPIPTGNFGAGAYRPGNGVTNPIRVREVKVVYTRAAMDAKIEGTVELEAVIGTDGVITDVRVVRSLDDKFGLDENATDVVRRTQFVPCKIGDKPVECLVVFELRYTLDSPTPIPAGQFGASAYRPGNGVTNPVRKGAVKPIYTKAAMDAKIEGTVELEAVIGPDGEVTDVRIVRSLDDTLGLDENAKDAVRKTSFVPCKVGERPVPCLVVFELTFTLR